MWYPPGADNAAITYCSDVDEFTSGFGVTASTNVSVRVTYKFRQPHLLYDAAVGKAAANALRDIVAQYARSCDGVEIFPLDSEPNAIWQCLRGEDAEVARLIRTAMGSLATVQ